MGVEPLRGRLEPWQLEIAADPDRLEALLAEHGSPLNLLDPGPMARNVDVLEGAAREQGLELEIFFARKANKALASSTRARQLGIGVDVASENELAPGPGARGRARAAHRHRRGEAALVARALRRGRRNRGGRQRGRAQQLTALRPDRGDRRRSRCASAPQRERATRFGLAAVGILDLVDRGRVDALSSSPESTSTSTAIGGGSGRGVGGAIWLVDRLRERDRPIRFLDMGGGIPMSYLESACGVGVVLARRTRTACAAGALR